MKRPDDEDGGGSLFAIGDLDMDDGDGDDGGAPEAEPFQVREKWNMNPIHLWKGLRGS